MLCGAVWLSYSMHACLTRQLLWRMILLLLCCAVFVVHADDFIDTVIVQPTKPDFNYASNSGFTVEITGSCVDGSRVWTYIPNTVIGAGLPRHVIVLLHGYSVLEPDRYEGLIEHLVWQGNYVIYPQYQEGSCAIGQGYFKSLFVQLLRKMSPARWSVQAVRAAQHAIQSLRINGYDSVYLFGHSLGGAFAMMWGSLTTAENESAVPITAAVLYSPQPMGFRTAIETHVRILLFFVFGKDIDVLPVAGETTFPIAILHGNDDTTAPMEDILPSYQALGSSSKAIYQAQTDNHGTMDLDANHNLALAERSGRETDSYDWRYVWSALDQVVNENRSVTELTFDMGTWSDGQRVKSVERID